MDFEDLIATLSKGSATAVTTLESNVAELNALKEYLYVQTPVEQALRAEIDSMSTHLRRSRWLNISSID